MFSRVVLALAMIAGADAFSKSWTGQARRSVKTQMSMKAAIFYSTTTGNTETCAGYIAEATGMTPVDIGDASADDITSCDDLICGAPTWHTGADEQRSGTEWDTFLYDTLPSLDLSGKKVAIFGDAMGELYDLFTKQGATIVGATSTDGYDHTDTKSIRDGKFVGMPFDEDNQYDMSEDRAKSWVEQLKSEGMAF